MVKKICVLRYKEAVGAIMHTTQVYCRRGVWNKYELIDTQEAISKINNSGYGADVYEKDGMYYVSIPNNSDMY